MGFAAGRFSNPADVFMKVLALNYPKKEEDLAKVEMLVSTYKSRQATQVQIEIKESVVP